MEIDLLTYPWSTFSWKGNYPGLFGEGNVRFFGYDAYVSFDYRIGWYVLLTKERGGEVQKCEYRPKSKKCVEQLLSDLREEAKSTFNIGDRCGLINLHR